MRGKVKFYNENKGYGFIIGDDDAEYFFHNTYQNDTKDIFKKDDEVTFLDENGPKGKIAKEVMHQ